MDNSLQQNNSQEQQNQTVVDQGDGGVSDRTREQFEKLTSSNQTLNQANEQLRRELEAYRAQAKAPAQPTVQQSIKQAQASGVDPASYVEVDPKTGERFVNENKLNDVLLELQTKTSKAEQTIQNYIKTNEDRRIQQQQEIAFKAHPELQPGTEKFDRKFYQKVRATLQDSMFNPDEYGKVFSLKEAADYVKGETIVTPQEPKVDGDKKEQDNGSAKADAGAFVPSQPQNAPQQPNSEELRSLRLATRKGNIDALAQRLLATDHVLKK